ncbi:MAG: hypothetical protein H0T15_08955 [Thermoleophilaceae bacterium]|nr:hypothetical protein [Thermoleophilaceae bacterium]
MKAVPLVVSFGVAVLLARPLLRTLPDRTNFRAAMVRFPAGALLIGAVVVALVPLGVIDQLTDGTDLWPAGFDSGIGIGGVVVFVLGCAALGLMDDLLGGEDRGVRGHGQALAQGRVSTGGLKAVGVLGLAAFTLSGIGLGTGEYLLAVALLTLTTNLFNVLDLRPGRSLKMFLALGAALAIADLDSLWLLGLFVGAVLVLLPLDLREHAMLGDTGSNAVGAVAGLWLVLVLGTIGQLIALALIAAITLYGEFRSISKLVDRTPPLRWLDSLGRLEERPHV